VTGFIVGAIVMFGLLCLRLGSGDFGWALRQANLLIHGKDPYSSTVGFELVPYPLTTIIFALPFLMFNTVVAGALFAGLSSGLLAFGITQGGRHRLLVFLSYPFWSAILIVQWSPLLMAASFLPWLFPVVIAKPNLGIAVALKSGRRVGLIVAGILVAVTIILRPNWPVTWWRQTAGYQHFLPVTTGLGILLLLLVPLLRNDTDARFLLLMAFIPQRWFYDALLLWLVPATTSEFLITGVLSWGSALLTPPTRTIHQVAALSVCFNYLPMLVVVLVRRAVCKRGKAGSGGWRVFRMRIRERRLSTMDSVLGKIGARPKTVIGVRRAEAAGRSGDRWLR